MFDMTVNMGWTAAVVCLQRALRACGDAAIGDDGRWGPATLAGMTSIEPETLLFALRAKCAAHYRLIAATRAGQAEFLHGWLVRAYS